MQEVLVQVKTIKETIANLNVSDTNVHQVEYSIQQLIALIRQTDKPADFLFPVFKIDMIDDLTLLTDKHLKNYWHSKSEDEKTETFTYIQSELHFSLALLLMTLEQS